MRGVRTAIVLVALASLIGVGCGTEKAGMSTADYDKQRAEIIARRQKMRAGGGRAGTADTDGGAPLPRTAGLRTTGQSFVYEPTGKRDPFRSFVLDRLKELEHATKGPLEQFDLNQLTVLGVVWETDRRRALVADPSGQAYIVSEGDQIGTSEGKVIRIDDNLMLVHESFVDHMGEHTMKEVEMLVRRNLEG